MKNANWLLLVLKLMLTASCLTLIITGLVLIFSRQAPKSLSEKSTKDSSYSKTQTVDTFKKQTVIVMEKVVHLNIERNPNSGNEKSVIETTIQKGYDLILLGIIILLLLLSLPFLSEFSFLQLISVKFREQVEAGKAIINESANAVNTNVASVPANIKEKAITTAVVPDDNELLRAEGIAQARISTYATDSHKMKWGGAPARNDRRLSASVIPLTENSSLFKITLKVISTNVENPLRGKVVFHIHDTFPNANPTIYVMQGVAVLELIAWGAFTVGAEADNGTTKLELDLAELPEAPLIFKIR